MLWACPNMTLGLVSQIKGLSLDSDLILSLLSLIQAKCMVLDFVDFTKQIILSFEEVWDLELSLPRSGLNFVNKDLNRPL